MDIYVDGNCFCPFCGQEMAGYKVHDGEQWWHRCYNEHPQAHRIKTLIENGTLGMHNLGHMIYISEDGCQVEGKGGVFTFDNEPATNADAITVDISDELKRQQREGPTSEFEFLNPLTNELETCQVFGDMPKDQS